MRLFAERGYHGVVDGRHRRGGRAWPDRRCTSTSPARRDILLDAYDRAGAFVIAGAADALRAATSPPTRSTASSRSYVEVAFDHVDLVVVTSREGASLPAPERPRLARRRRDLHEQWAAVLRELRPDLSPPTPASLVRSALALVAALARQRRDGSPSVDATVDLVRAFLLGRATTDPRTAQEQP